MASFADLLLSGRRVKLEPLSQAHVPALVAAASESRETYGLTSVPDGDEAMGRYVQVALAERERGASVPFATVDLARDAVVGSTRFMNIEMWTWPSGERARPVPGVPFEAAEIGSTWLAASAQRTAVNTEAKLLMLTHAFEAWGLRRVNLKTDARNVRSRTAIERLGARLDGILRAHVPAFDGGVRDTAIYSILASEWPAVKATLQTVLSRAQ
jgi:RimJ/RimL family protein N-acetyltransferase